MQPSTDNKRSDTPPPYRKLRTESTTGGVSALLVFTSFVLRIAEEVSNCLATSGRLLASKAMCSFSKWSIIGDGDCVRVRLCVRASVWVRVCVRASVWVRVCMFGDPRTCFTAQHNLVHTFHDCSSTVWTDLVHAFHDCSSTVWTDLVHTFHDGRSTVWTDLVHTFHDGRSTVWT